jgi:hypothetical protein
VPGDDGRVYLLDAATGESRAEPLVPVFDRAHPTRWRAPARLDGDAVALADQAGKVRRLVLVKDPRPRLVAAAEAAIGKELTTDPGSTGTAVVLATSDGRVRSLTARDLSPIGAWPLEAPAATPPFAVAGHLFVVDRAGGVIAIGPDGQRLWAITLKGGAPVGAPVVADQSVVFLSGDGALERISLTDGAPLEEHRLGILPAGGPLSLGSRFVVPVANGTLRLLQTNSSPRAAENPQ